MRLNAPVSWALLSASARAADLSGFKAGPGVEPQLKDFLEIYFPFSEHISHTDEWTDWWHAEEGSITKSGKTHAAVEDRLAVKQALFPSPDLTLNHIVGDVNVLSDKVGSKTYNETVVVEITDGVTGWCGGFAGFVVAEIKKTEGKVDFTPHGGNYLTYILDLPSAPNTVCRHQDKDGEGASSEDGRDTRDEL